jgi:L-threonine kinase
MIRPRSATAMVPLTCGELVQGTDADGTAFLVSCPIDRTSRVRVTIEEQGVDHGPPDRPRALAAARRTLDALARRSAGRHQPAIRLEIRSGLPVARGLGTSTADVAGAIAATAAALGEHLEPSEIARLAVAIEPSDGTMLPGLALFEGRTGGRWEALGAAPPIAVVALDFGGAVDTIAHHAAGAPSSASLVQVQRLALAQVRRGIATADPGAVGAGATLSALANEVVLPKPALHETLELAVRLGAYGVCAAHSGTALGLLLPPEPELVLHALAIARRTLPGLVDTWSSPLASGGVRLSGGRRPVPARQPELIHQATRS